MLPPHTARYLGTRHMASSAHYLGAQAAYEILEAGGNAIDAGVAGGIALSIVQSEFLNFAGVAPIVVRTADGRVTTISGLGCWPKAASIDYFVKNHGGRIPTGIMSTVVPAAPDAWITALERFGTMSFGQIVVPAIRYATEGYCAQEITGHIVSNYMHRLETMPDNAALFLRNGEPPAAGEVLRQPDTAASLVYMAEQEAAVAARAGRRAGLDAARAAFYRGEIAERIVRFHEENGGWLTRQDLASFRVEVEPALTVEYQGLEVHGCGFWCQGPVLLQTLKILEKFNLASMKHNSSAYIHLIVEALKLAFADRHAYYGDTKFVEIPGSELLSSDYAKQRSVLIDPNSAHDGMPDCGETSVELGRQRPAASPKWCEPPIDTSYISVVDREGNSFSATPSDDRLNSPLVPGTGLVPSPRGTQSFLDPNHPAAVGPGRRPRLTPSPATVVKPGEWVMPIGSPGNDVQPQAMLQVILNLTAFGMTPREALQAPRFATYSFPATSDPHDYHPNRVTLEGRIPATTADELARLGHNIAWWPDWDWRAGCVCFVLADLKTGVKEGAPDPRRPSGCAGR